MPVINMLIRLFERTRIKRLHVLSTLCINVIWHCCIDILKTSKAVVIVRVETGTNEEVSRRGISVQES